MKLSLNWIKEFIEIEDLSAEKLADLLTMKTCEVDAVLKPYEFLKDIVIAKVIKKEKHPDADKLSVLQMDIGRKQLQVVTGATNVVVGNYYPLAMIGAQLPSSLEIKASVLRGIASEGMLCSLAELNLEGLVLQPNQVKEGVLDIPAELLDSRIQIGSSFNELVPIDEIILEIDNKSITHRPDLWSHFGFARELSSLLKHPLKQEVVQKIFPVTKAVDEKLSKVSINIKARAAIGYSATNFEGVVVKISSLLIQARLLLLGMRPINNVVDASNYVMLELGQPNHAYDRKSIKGPVVIEHLDVAEKFLTLDAIERELPPQTIVIKDNSTIVAIAGVMGGQNSEISEGTDSLLFESAAFHRQDIRFAVAKLALRSEASQRFEKGQDPTLISLATHRFAWVLSQSLPSLKMGEINLLQKEQTLSNTITTKISYILQRLGKAELDSDQIVSILKNLNMDVTTQGDLLKVVVPSYRSYFDLTLAEDLVEEIGRTIGYKEFQPLPVQITCEVPQSKNNFRKMEHRLRQVFSEVLRYQEVYNYAFASEEEISGDRRHSQKAIRLANPVAQDIPYMRTSPLGGLVKNIRNLYKTYDELKFYEIEKIFLADQIDADLLPLEKEFCAGVWFRHEKLNKEISFESVLESFFQQLASAVQILGLSEEVQHYRRLAEFKDSAIFHSGRSGQICLNLQNEIVPLITWGQLHPALCDSLKLPRQILYFEMFLADLAKIRLAKKKYSPVVRHMVSEFEFTVIVDKKMDFVDLEKLLELSKSSLADVNVSRINYLGSYSGNPIAENKKAVSVALTFLHETRTLKPEEIKQMQDDVLVKIDKAGLELR